jgi:D(-)-tartrate dehydratase
LRITAIHDDVLPIRSAIRNAWIDFAEMDCSIVAVVSDVIRNGRPLIGYGFNSNGRYSQSCIIRRRLAPRILGAAPGELLDAEETNFDPARVLDAMMRNEKPGGHGERSVAVGAIDMAVADLVAKIADVPLWRWLSDRHGDGEADETVAVYAAGGYYFPGKGLTELQDEIRGFLDGGYTRVKMKIGGASLAEDLERIEAVLAVVGDGSKLAVDANARFDLETALSYGKALEPYDLAWYEEPSDPLDYQTHSRISEAYRGALATGENLFSTIDVVNLMRHGGMRPDRDILQFDPVLSYGHVEYLRTLQFASEYGWSSRSCIPHGGHQFALHLAAAFKLGGNESYPNEFYPAGGFSDGAAVTEGRVRPPESPGIGIEEKAVLYSAFRALHE